MSIASTGMLWFDVLRRVDELTVTRSDNTQWTISQLEVDTLRVALAIGTAESGGAEDLAALRQRFDILYSRFRTLERASTYRLLFADADYVAAQDDMARYLERQLRFIDGTDADLRAALPAIAADTMAAHAAVRAMALRGLHVFAEVSDRQRSEVVGLILRTGVGAALLLAVLAVVLLVLLQTGRRAAAAARRTAEANRNLAMIVNTSLDAIVLADEKGVVRAFNPAAETTFGWTSAEAIGRPMTELMIPEHHHAAHDAGMRRFLETGETRVLGAGRVQLDARHKSGRVFPVELSLSTERDETGRIFVAFLRDITRRREAEDALTAARDDALAGARKKAEFLAMMSHEIRTPLNGMLGAIELLGDSPLDPRQERWLATLKGSGQLLLQHVNDVLDLSRLDAGQAGLRRERVDLRALCAEVVASQDTAARAAGNTNSCVVSDAVPEAVRLDGRRLSQVLLNLLGNANKFTRNGAVRVSVDAHAAGPGRFGLEIHVADTGIGIPADDRERIFEEFVMLDTSYHRDAAGTGLGLAISRRIVQSMGGRIDVIDTPGGGADFRIHLEVEAETQRATARTASVTDAHPSAVRPLDILLVEDNAVNREILREMLERDGHAVTEATDGADAVAKAGSRGFDLILMDISMPGMDGVEAATRIRSGGGPNAGTPAVAVTAHALPEEVERFRRAGMTRTVTKPVDRRALRELLRALPHLGGGDAVSDAATGAGAAMDEERLAELAEAIGEARFLDVIRDFIAQGDAMAEAARGDAATRDPEGFVAELHALAGVAGLLGAHALHEALGRAETAFKLEGLPVAEVERHALRHLWHETRAACLDLLD